MIDYHFETRRYTRPINLFEDGEWAILEWEGGGTWHGEFAGLPGSWRQN